MAITSVNKFDIPYGTGSLQQRGNVWWMIFRTFDGAVVQENSRTTDCGEARRLLAKRALVTLRARITALQAIIRETPKPARTAAADSGKKQRHRDAQHGRRDRPVPAHSARRGRGGARA